MTTSNSTRRFTVAALGLALAGAGGLATAAAATPDDDTTTTAGVDLAVDIESLTPPGVLAFSVASDEAVALTENGSDDTARQFTATLPTVTVSDSRTPEEIPDGAYWAVVGQAGAFTADGLDPIGPEYLGWTPRLLSPSPTGLVEAGQPVSSVLEDGSGAAAVGLEGQELLVSSFDSAAEHGPWDVTADLALRVPVDTAAGEYRSVLTLSLFESQ